MGPILVTGATGTLGREVVAALRAAGRDVRALSRHPRGGDAAVEWVTGDLTTGAGLDEAVAGTTAVIHCATDTRRPRNDLVGTRNLVVAARRGGSPHLVYISIVGVDRVPLGYYRRKLDVERLVEESGLPWSILRATQFHDLVVTLLRVLGRLPVMFVSTRTSFQPVDTRDVAARLVELAVGPPVGRAPDFGGPRVATTAELAREYLRAVGRRRPVVPVRLPGRLARAYEEGGHLAPEHADGRRTFEEFLAERVARRS